jgi:hypothetical protein
MQYLMKIKLRILGWVAVLNGSGQFDGRYSYIRLFSARELGCSKLTVQKRADLQKVLPPQIQSAF